MIQKEMNIRPMMNMTLAAFGIQFGSALQMANMSTIYKYLGANVDNMAFLWLAAPITGLLAQPIIGFMSDKSWLKFLPGRFGRRQPYILFYSILAFISLILMPNSINLVMAAILLWVLGLSNNGATEPFRAMIGDITPAKQMTKAFAIQTALACSGAMLAALLPWIMINVFGLTGDSTGGDIPISIKLAFYIGACSFLFFVCWSIFSTKEYPPENMDDFLAEKEKNMGPILMKIGKGTKELGMHIINMPQVVKDFWIPQFFLWFGLFCMWIYFGIGIAQNIYGLPAGVVVKGNAVFSSDLMSGAAWCGVCFAAYQCVGFVFSFFLPSLARKIGEKAAYGLTLFAGAIGLSCAVLVHNEYLLILCMVGVGITWAGVMTMPYSIIAREVAQKELGVYMGLFNMTITIPQIFCALALAFIARDFFHNSAMEIVCLGGCMMFVAGLLMLRLQWRDNRKARKAQVA